MHWWLYFRVYPRRFVLQAAGLQRLRGWRFLGLWIYSQNHHFRHSSSCMTSKNLLLNVLNSSSLSPHHEKLVGKHLLQKTSGNRFKKTAQSEIRGQGVRLLSLSTFSGVFIGRNNGGKEKLSLKDVTELIQKKECQRIVVMTGAGLSTPSGIPDFRSPGSGLYSNLQQYNIPYPEAIFELSYFFQNPKPFFLLAKELYPGNFRPNYAHYFLRLLLDKGLLLRVYTQNIDGLERVAGIPPDKLVEAHGTFASATCTVCQKSYPGEDFRGDVMNEKIPKCPVCSGMVKPDIVFFGEELPHRFFLHMVDFPMADLLFIIGTSLEVWTDMNLIE